MKELLGIFAAIILVVAIIVGIDWIGRGSSVAQDATFNPIEANIQRKTFENTAPYNEGMANDLRRMQEEYISADPDHKAAIGSLIVSEFASYDTTRLPPDLRDFYYQVKQDQGLTR